MIGYITLGTNDLEKAKAFYDALLGELGASRIMSDDHMALWATKPGVGMLSLIQPYDKKEATIGNGTMTAIAVENPEMVAKMHAKALSLGGTDEGAPGPRGDKMEFGYCRDLEGHKLAFYCMR